MMNYDLPDENLLLTLQCYVNDEAPAFAEAKTAETMRVTHPYAPRAELYDVLRTYQSR